MPLYDITEKAGRFIAGVKLSAGQIQISLTESQAMHPVSLGEIVLAGTQPPPDPPVTPVLDTDVLSIKRGTWQRLATALEFKTYCGSTGGSFSGAWADLTGKPATFAPAAHAHTIDDVMGLETALDGKAGIAAVTAALESKAALIVPVETKTANYTVAAADNGKLLRVNAATALTLTLPADAAVGTAITVVQAGAGQVTFAAASGGVLLEKDGFTKTAKQNAAVYAVAVENAGGAAAAWLLSGAMAA